jgi:WbqC-like protein
MTLTVAIHQPEHLPWLGFFNKMDQADLFVMLDVVQYRRDYFQNRNRILGPGGPQWLTVPVVRSGYTKRILAEMEINNDVRVTNKADWRRRHWKTISTAYGRHPFFADHRDFLRDVYAREWRLLTDLNEHLIRCLTEALGIATDVVRASDLAVTGSSSELLLQICRATGATAYLSGPTGRDYLDERLFGDAGMELRYHAFEHPEYPQRGGEGFVSHLSVLDLLMNAGPESLAVVRSGTREPGRPLMRRTSGPGYGGDPSGGSSGLSTW